MYMNKLNLNFQKKILLNKKNKKITTMKSCRDFFFFLICLLRMGGETNPKLKLRRERKNKNEQTQQGNSYLH